MQNSKHKYEKYNQKKGDVFGRLTLTGVTYFKEMYGKRRRMVEAKCECGKVRDYVFDLIKKGDTRSCGCWKSDELKENPHAKTHGYTNHPLYTVYLGMKERCYRKKAINFPDYGGRGICICKEWLDSPKKFIEWALNNGWKKGLDIDRKDNDGNYEPGNCRFVTEKRSSRNRRSARMITAFGETKCLTDWSEDYRCSVSRGRIWERISRGTWASIEEIISTPQIIRGRNIKNRAVNRNIFAFGEEKSLAEWLKDERCLADEERLRLRLRKGINRGWSAEKAIITPVRKLRSVI